MKVLCIDATFRSYSVDRGHDIEEGQTYEVEAEFRGFLSGALYYGLVGFYYEIGIEGFRADRFVPVSEINETEFERSFNKQTELI